MEEDDVDPCTLDTDADPVVAVTDDSASAGEGAVEERVLCADSVVGLAISDGSK